ncbi:hypothetical protein E1B28_003518 [Marasmius oreades]|uniref:MYND-type domain-containing protein n=1 Tax=Marasmius oreades TaxID=181124 RepID=A0A9P7RM48_9AGAR|nr:uncharacterized protein E1B28_003518 [Marasmius oreades]KAG7085995.1 hypothetical protein E1B28_003518 [Marasmius oreades]
MDRRIRLDLRRPPPNVIDLDHPDTATVKVLQLLTQVAKAIYSDRSTVACRFIEEEWDGVWRWVLSLSRAVLDQQATTPAGNSFAEMILDPLPVLLVYRTIPNGWNTGIRLTELDRLVVSAPKIIALSVELWLFANDIEFPSIPAFCDCASSYARFLLMHGGNTPHGKVAKHHLDQLLVNPRWDVPRSFIKYLIREASKPVFQYFTVIRRSLLLAATLSKLYARPDQLPSPFLKGFLQNNAPRWIVLILLKLANPKCNGNETDHLVVSNVQQCLEFLHICFTADISSLLEALDAGLVLSIFKHRDLVIRVLRNSANPFPVDVAEIFAQPLEHITSLLYHRRVFVRVIRSLKKVQKKGLDPKPHFKGSGPRLHGAWITLLAEADAKHLIYKEGRETQLGWYDAAVCEYKNCYYRDSLTSIHQFKRCSGCKIEIYCSSECQKGAWKAHHRQECQGRLERSDQILLSGPSSLDLAFLRKCVYSDYQSRAKKYQRLMDDRRAQYPQGVAILMDYRKDPMEAKAISLSDARVLGRWSKEDTAVVGIACVPWERKVITVNIRSRPGSGGTSEKQVQKSI